MVITRFAPSPTGYLHIGGARTALFNYLYAKHFNGQYLLRIEDTDRIRSTQSAIDVILQGLKWLNLPHDGEIMIQSSRIKQHQMAVEQLLASGLAYHCYASEQELTELRQQQLQQKIPTRYDGRWRPELRVNKTPPPNQKPVVRIKMPLTGSTKIHDAVQGKIEVQNTELDDFILLRADGTPTYMLSAVVDDVAMGITHIIRGADHLTNTFRQYHLFHALLSMGGKTTMPEFAHVPLILNDTGEKLSKRNGAASLLDYQQQGILPEAMENYLLRLGFSHGNDEIISRQQAITWFDLTHVGKSPARTDQKKLLNLNRHYIQQQSGQTLLSGWQVLPNKISADDESLTNYPPDRIIKILELLKSRHDNLISLFNELRELFTPPKPDPLPQDSNAETLKNLKQAVANNQFLIDEWLEKLKPNDQQDAGLILKNFLKEKNLQAKDFMPLLRFLITGKTHSLGVNELLQIYTKDEIIERLSNAK